MAEGPLSDSEILDRAILAMEVAHGTYDPREAMRNVAAHALHGLSSTDLILVAAYLAVNAVRGRPPAELATLLETLRLEHLITLDVRDDHA